MEALYVEYSTDPNTDAYNFLKELSFVVIGNLKNYEFPSPLYATPVIFNSDSPTPFIVFIGQSEDLDIVIQEIENFIHDSGKTLPSFQVLRKKGSSKEYIQNLLHNPEMSFDLI